jgi:hypothetical protein
MCYFVNDITMNNFPADALINNITFIDWFIVIYDCFSFVWFFFKNINRIEIELKAFFSVGYTLPYDRLEAIFNLLHIFSNKNKCWVTCPASFAFVSTPGTCLVPSRCVRGRRPVNVALAWSLFLLFWGLNTAYLTIWGLKRGRIGVKDVHMK